MSEHEAPLDDLLAQAAGPTLNRIRRDRRKLPEELRPLLAQLEPDENRGPHTARLFNTDLEAGKVWDDSGVLQWHSATLKDKLGRPLWSYVVSRRMTVAQELLRDTKLTVGTIATMVGYIDHSRFSENFRNTTGQTPRDYRRDVTASDLIEAVGKAEKAGHLKKARADLAKTDVALKLKQRRLDADVLYEAAVEQRDAGNGDLSYQLLQGVKGVDQLTGVSADIIARRRTTGLHWDTDEAFIQRLNKNDQKLFRSDKGDSIRQFLRQGALGLVPRDLDFFRECTDESYLMTWDALDRARYGLIPDAFKAWFISEHAADPLDRDAPATLGRFIKCGVKIDELWSGDQEERLRYCEVAIDIAQDRCEPLVETMGKLWSGNVLRLLGRYLESWNEFSEAEKASKKTTWLNARRDNMLGLYMYNKHEFREALSLFRSAADYYRALDLHWTGLLLIEQGTVHFHTANYKDSLDAGQAALELVDARRSPLITSAYLPINLSENFTFMGQLDKAMDMMSKCDYSRRSNPSVAAAENIGWAHIHFRARCYEEALSCFQEAVDQYKVLKMDLDTALALGELVVTYLYLGRRTSAIECYTTSLAFFEAARCSSKVLSMVGQLRGFLDEKTVVATNVSRVVREIAAQCGRRLPATD